MMNSKRHSSSSSRSSSNTTNTTTTTRPRGHAGGLLQAALALGAALALLVPGAAQANPDVRWSVTIGSPGHGHPGHPGVVYLPPPRGIYVHPAPIVYGPPAYGHYRERRHQHKHHHHHHHYYQRDDDDDDDRGAYRRGARRDSDRDGVPDRWDRRPENPWRH